MYEMEDYREDYRGGGNNRADNRGNYRPEYREDYRDDYREDYRAGGNNRGESYRGESYRGGSYRGGNNRAYRDEYGRNRRAYRGSYRSQDEYIMMLEEIVSDNMELARAYEDVSEMATDSNERQKLMKIADREKEHYRYAKEMLEKHM